MGRSNANQVAGRMWRVTTTLVAATLVMLAAGLATQVGPASATTIAAPSTVSADFIGWARLRPGQGSCQYSLDTYSVQNCHQERYPAYEWTAAGWQSRTLASGAWVYVYPYSGSWAWAYTERTGWYAIQRSFITPQGPAML